MVAGLRPWQLGFCVLLFEGVIGKEALEMSAFHLPSKKGENGSVVKHNNSYKVKYLDLIHIHSRDY